MTDTSTISKATFVYYSEKAENNLKIALLKTLEEAKKDKEDEFDIIQVATFAAMDFGLKNQLLSGAFRDLDAFKDLVERFIDHLVTEDEDIQKAIKAYALLVKNKKKQ